MKPHGFYLFISNQQPQMHPRKKIITRKRMITTRNTNNAHVCNFTFVYKLCMHTPRHNTDDTKLVHLFASCYCFHFATQIKIETFTKHQVKEWTTATIPTNKNIDSTRVHAHANNLCETSEVLFV